MTDLTDKWRKGELPDGWYYTKIDLYENGDYIEIIPNTYNDCFEYGIVKEVLAPVPSYEEWKIKLEENTKLKELLKECRRPVCWYVDIFKNKAELLTKINQVLGEDK